MVYKMMCILPKIHLNNGVKITEKGQQFEVEDKITRDILIENKNAIDITDGIPADKTLIDKDILLSQLEAETKAKDNLSKELEAEKERGDKLSKELALLRSTIKNQDLLDDENEDSSTKSNKKTNNK